jgi:hypothetical protein
MWGKKNFQMQLEKQGFIRQRLKQVEAMSGMLFWSIGSGVIRKVVLWKR